MEATNGKHFVTDQYALVAHGSAEKPWPFSACSDSKFSIEEYDRFVSTMQKESIRIPSRKYLSGRLDDINSLLNTKWNEDEINTKIAKQRAMERKHDPANAPRLKRENITKRKLRAEESGDADEIVRCDAELAALENNMASSSLNGSNGARPSPIKKSNATKQERLAQLNAKNRGKNAEEVRKALLEEKRKLQAAREQAATEAKTKAEQKRKAEEAKLLAVPRSDMSDLFGEGSDISRAGTPLGGTPRRSRAGTPMNGVKKEKSLLGAVGAIKKKNLDDDVIGSMDLGIDVEI